MKNIRLSKNFTLNEFLINSRKFIFVPEPEIVFNLNRLCIYVLQPLRDCLKSKITITSGYRSPAYNKLIGGVPKSQHMLGEAADFRCFDLRRAYLFIKNNLIFDQLIIYVNEDFKAEFIHVSYSHAENEKECLICVKENGERKYLMFSLVLFGYIK